MRAAKNIFANIDKVSIILYVILILFGLLNIYASQYNDDMAFSLDLSSRYAKQMLFIGAASITALLILIINLLKAVVFKMMSIIFYLMPMILKIGMILTG